MDTTIPIIINDPMSDSRLRDVCVSSSIQITPMNPNGTAARITRGSRYDLNRPTITRYTSTTASGNVTPNPRIVARMLSSSPFHEIVTSLGSVSWARRSSTFPAIAPRSLPVTPNITSIVRCRL